MNHPYQSSLAYAQLCDAEDALASYRHEFLFPQYQNNNAIYLCGNSLGLQPKSTADYVQQELQEWARLGVEGHFKAKSPWMPYHELLLEPTANIVGAKPTEVITMNSLTVNLHLMMVSFYRPTPKRFKILIEAHAFPSDVYAVKSQLQFHGFNPDIGVIEVQPEPGQETLSTEAILEVIAEQGDEIALILFGGVNYLTGQVFDMPAITQAGHAKGCMVGFDLAHAAGNVMLHLHDWDVDFAVWCSYKYLNGGPGTIAGCFVHERHTKSVLPRFEGWWGHNKTERFKMQPEFKAIESAEAWQLSNPPIFQLAALRASMDLFDAVGMKSLREKSERLTGYLEFLLNPLEEKHLEILTPCDPIYRGSQLSVRLKQTLKNPYEAFLSHGVYCDFREPDVMRISPTALYNSFEDVYRLAEILKQIILESE